MTDEFVKLLDQGCADLGGTLSDQQKQQFFKYYEMLIAKNEVMNLTAITEFEEVVQKHFIDSVMIKEVREPGDNEKWIDVGTGAGFPGIPLAILNPDTEFVLADSLKKRLHSIDQVTEKCTHSFR